MADNARTFVAASSQTIFRVNPTGVLANHAWTLMGWFKFTTLATDGNILFHLGPQGDLTRGIICYVTSAGQLRIRQSDTEQVDSGANVVTTGTWVQLGFTRAGSGTQQNRIIISGADVGGGNMDAPAEITTGDGIYVSDNNPGLGQTYLDGLSAWDSYTNLELSAANTGTFLNNPQSLVTSYGTSGSITANALKVYWPMQCAGATEVDKSGQSNDGTITGATLSTGGGPSPSTPWVGVCGGGSTIGRLVGGTLCGNVLVNGPLIGM